MDKETLWVLERLAAQELPAKSADRMLRALELLCKQELHESMAHENPVVAEMEVEKSGRTEESEPVTNVDEEVAVDDSVEPEETLEPLTVEEPVEGKEAQESELITSEEVPKAEESSLGNTALSDDISDELSLADDDTGTASSWAETVGMPRLEHMSDQLRNRIPESLMDRFLKGAKKMQGEHRLATTLFADVSAAAGMASVIPLDLHVSAMNDCAKMLVDTICVKYEGCISHIIGDRVLALFGVPIPHENDAERSILAALDIREGMRELGFDVSIGANTGMVQVGEMRSGVYLECGSWSSDIDLANILQDAASPGEIWVGTPAYRLIHRSFDFGEAIDIVAGGIAGPQITYPVLGISDHSEQLWEIGDLNVERTSEENKLDIPETSHDSQSVMRDEAHNILLVDDEANGLNALKSILRKRYNVFLATNGQNALTIMEQNDIAVIITGHRMHGMTGIELLERTLREYPDTIRVILAAYTDEELLVGAINKVRVHSFLPKPWETEEVKAVVAEAIRTYKISQWPGQVPRTEKKSIGETLVENGLISRTQLDTAMKLQESQRKPGEEPVIPEAASSEEFGMAMDLQLAETILGLGYVDEKDILFCYALRLGADCRLLSQIASNSELAEMLPLKLAYKYFVVPVSVMGQALIVAAQKPLSNTAKSELEAKLGCAVIVRIISDI